jgi:hypothetical protein
MVESLTWLKQTLREANGVLAWEQSLPRSSPRFSPLCLGNAPYAQPISLGRNV